MSEVHAAIKLNHQNTPDGIPQTNTHTKVLYLPAVDSDDRIFFRSAFTHIRRDIGGTLSFRACNSDVICFRLG